MRVKNPDNVTALLLYYSGGRMDWTIYTFFDVALEDMENSRGDGVPCVLIDLRKAGEELRGTYELMLNN